MRLLNLQDSQINLKEEMLKRVQVKKAETISKEDPIIRLTKEKTKMVKIKIKHKDKAKYFS